MCFVFVDPCVKCCGVAVSVPASYLWSPVLNIVVQWLAHLLHICGALC
jgi:hypothetical protein